MQKNHNLIWGTVAALVFVACACAGLVVLAAGAIFFWSAGQQALPPVGSNPCGTAPLPPPGQGSLPPEIICQMENIEGQVAGLRGLQPDGEYFRVLFTPEQLRQHIMDDFFGDYTQQDARDDTLVLAAFGLLDPEFDYYSFYVDLLSEQIAGFYDNESKEMVVVQGGEFLGPERLTYAHEYVHALQDQNYDLKDGLGYDDDRCEQDSERCAAIQALLEGDATYFESSWFSENGTRSDQREIQAYYADYEAPIFDTAPIFIQQDFLFPYTAGLDFVTYLLEQGGTAALESAYQNPPVSTEQILHPERYPSDIPIPVSIPDLLPVLGEGWELLDENVMGEWYTYLILANGRDPQARLNELEASQAAAGWGGDSYAVYFAPESGATLLVLTTLWDSSSEANEFAAAFETYANARFNPATSSQPLTWQTDDWTTLFWVDDLQTTWISAHSPATATAVREALQKP